MKRSFLLYFAVVVSAFLFILPSCKKTAKSTHPTPDNVRLLGYKVTTTPLILQPSPVPMQTTSASYSFSYNGDGKVYQITYSTNDSNIVKIFQGNQISTFTYSGNTIYKTTTLVATNKVLERDTFTTNGSGQVTNANFMWSTAAFSYYGQLLYHESYTYRDTGTTITGSATYTSSSGDFLKRTFDGNLKATFPDTGIKPVLIFPDTVRDSAMGLPLKVTWTTIGPGGAVVIHDASSYSDQLTGYSEYMVSVSAVGGNGIMSRVATFPADLGATKDYLFYGDYNRVGDFLQLGSFTTYGINIYQNANMVKEIKSDWIDTKVKYTIDADSKVTQFIVTAVDRFGNVTTSVYDLQYATK